MAAKEINGINDNNLYSFYLPETFSGHYSTISITGESGIKIKTHELKNSFFTCGLSDFYKKAFMTLASYKVKDIIFELDTVSRKFLDKNYHGRITAIKAISAITGFSEETTAESIDLEFSSSLQPEMESAMINEFGSTDILDNFVKSAGDNRQSRAMAAGPAFAVSSSNIPALPHLSVMRAFITKNPVIVKTSFDEPIFMPLYMQAFKEINSPLAECAAIICYKSGGTEGTEFTEKFIDNSNIIIAYGGIEAEKYFSNKIKYPKKLIMHPHRLGFGVIGEGALEPGSPAKEIGELAHSIAADAATFEQRACLAPHVYFYCIKGNEDITIFIKHLMKAFEEYEIKLPPAAISNANLFSRRAFLDSLLFDKSVIEIHETRTQKSAVIEISAPPKFPLSPLNRTLFIARYERPEEILSILRPLDKYLQNAALRVKKADESFWFDALCALNVSRICAPGNMPAPTMMWRHDGIGALIEMCKFCDIEKYR